MFVGHCTVSLGRPFQQTGVQCDRFFLTAMGSASFISLPIQMRVAPFSCRLSVQSPSPLKGDFEKHVSASENDR
jgi:hypothetical protein